MGLHRIRLAAPWELCHRTVGSAETASASSTCKIPLALSDLVPKEADSQCETILLSRKFHCPTGIDGSTRLLIEIELENCVWSQALNAVMLNGQSLSISSSNQPSDRLLQIDVTGRMIAFNVLQLQVPIAASHTSGRLLSVTLVIEE
jgi:hypothetical protein